MKRGLSVVLATRNEGENIGPCLEAVKGIASEIVVVDEGSIDETVKIAKKYGARVYEVEHEEIFHKTKQKALEKAKYEWILQLDADERVTGQLASEISRVINMDQDELNDYEVKDERKRRIFDRHQRIIGGEARGGNVVAFYVARKNMFLGKPLIHGGVYPDGVIRLVKNGRASFPAKSVHEQIKVDGRAAWLRNDLEHHDSPTFKRYFARLNRYTDLHAKELEERGVALSYSEMFKRSFVTPALVFLRLYVRHKGFVDGFRGFLWAFYSSMHFPIAYFKYWQGRKV